LWAGLHQRGRSRAGWRMFLNADFGRVNARVFCNLWTSRGSRRRR
jgi:hypothetical protein